MKNSRLFIALTFPVLILSGCTSTFFGTAIILNFSSLISYVLIAFALALLIALKSEKKKEAFWIWFILSLVLTPLAGFIYLLILFSRKIKD